MQFCMPCHKSWMVDKVSIDTILYECTKRKSFISSHLSEVEKQVLNILEQYKDIGSGPVDFNSPKIDYGGVFESRLDVIEKLYIDFCSRNTLKKKVLWNLLTWKLGVFTSMYLDL